MMIKYHISTVPEEERLDAGDRFLLRREGSGNGRLFTRTFEGLLLGMIKSYFSQDVRERLEIILDEETLTTDQIQLARLVVNLSKAYEGNKRLTKRPLYQLMNEKP